MCQRNVSLKHIYIEGFKKSHTSYKGFERKRKFYQIKIHAIFSLVICFIMHLNKWYAFLKTEIMLTTALKLCSHFNFYLYLIDKCKPGLFYYRKIIYPLMEIFNKFVCDFFIKCSSLRRIVLLMYCVVVFKPQVL